MTLADLFFGKPKSKPPFPPKKASKGKDATLADFIRTYGKQDGPTMFQAHQIKAKRRGKR